METEEGGGERVGVGRWLVDRLIDRYEVRPCRLTIITKVNHVAGLWSRDVRFAIFRMVFLLVRVGCLLTVPIYV
jgi:hypothetical protein